MTDPVVEEIKLTLEAESDMVCFTAETFVVNCSRAHKVSRLAGKAYKLSESGLHQTKKKRYQNRVKEFWLRPGWRLVGGKR